MLGCTEHTLVQMAAGRAVGGAPYYFGWPWGGQKGLSAVVQSLQWSCSYTGGPGSLRSAQPDAVLLEEPWVLALC